MSWITKAMRGLSGEMRARRQQYGDRYGRTS